MLRDILVDTNLALLVLDLLPLQAIAFLGAVSRCFRRRVTESIACDELAHIGADQEGKVQKWIRSRAFSILRARKAPSPTTSAHRAPYAPHSASAFVCAATGDSAFLLTLHTVAPRDLLQRTNERGDNIAHTAARHGHGSFIRTLHTLGYSELLQATNDHEWTVAHCALDGLHEEVLQTIVSTGYQYMFHTPHQTYASSYCDKPKTQAETAAWHMYKLIQAKKQNLSVIEGRYKSGRLAGASRSAQDKRRVLKMRLRAALRIVLPAACTGLPRPEVATCPAPGVTTAPATAPGCRGAEASRSSRLQGQDGG